MSRHAGNIYWPLATGRVLMKRLINLTRTQTETRTEVIFIHCYKHKVLATSNTAKIFSSSLPIPYVFQLKSLCFPCAGGVKIPFLGFFCTMDLKRVESSAEGSDHIGGSESFSIETGSFTAQNYLLLITWLKFLKFWAKKAASKK